MGYYYLNCVGAITIFWPLWDDGIKSSIRALMMSRAARVLLYV